MKLCKYCESCDWTGARIDFMITEAEFYCFKINSSWTKKRYAHVFPVICKFWKSLDLLIDDLGYICADCAKKADCFWPIGHIATWHQGECPYCMKEKSLVSTGDWDWPDTKTRGMRD